MKKNIFPTTHGIAKCLTMLVALFINQHVSGQTYTFDYMTLHQTPSGDLQNRAIHKDAANSSYYLAQMIDQEHYALVISKVDADFNPINTYKYDCVMWAGADVPVINNNMYITPHDISFFGNQIIVVGEYIEEGVDRGGFMFSADKTTGAFQWFQKYTGVYTLQSVVCNNLLGGAITVGWRIDGQGYQFPGYTGEAGVLMRMDNTGNVVWQKDVEENKYLGSGITQIFNKLTHVIQIGTAPMTFAAVGQVGAFLNFTMPYNDGDGTLIIFDRNGIISKQVALGNVDIIGANNQNLQYEAALSVATCSDGDLVIAGSVLEFPETYLSVSCPGPVPTEGGVWVTKINPITDVIAWSKVFDWWPNPYDPNSFPQIFDVDIMNDGNDNFGIQYYSELASIMKVDINGNLLYSRRYDDPNGAGLFWDMSTGMGSTDILAVGNLFSAQFGWNVKAFDNINDRCHSEDLPLVEYPHEYDVFPVVVGNHPTMPRFVSFIEPPESITNIVECNSEPVDETGGGDDDGSGGKGGLVNNNLPQVSHDIQSGNVMIKVSSGEVYTGTLLNSLGQTIVTYENIRSVYSLKTNNLAKGIYYLRLNNGKTSMIKHVLVQ